MAITTLSSREFNQDRSRAVRAASKGPVYITRRGHPSLVLLTFEDYQKMTEKRGTLLERLTMPCDIDIDFEPPRMNLELRIPEFDAEVYGDAVDSNQRFESVRSQHAPAVR
jgi:prevent-host-death family protein